MIIIFNNLIWDFDGTLFDTYPPQIQILIDILKEDYAEEVSVQFINFLTQVSLSHTFKTIAVKYNIEVDELINKFREKYSRISPEQQKPMPYVREICRKIIQAGGSNFINTHRDRGSLENLINYFNMSEFFIENVSKDNGFARKPDPESFKYLIDKYNLNLSETLAVGDRKLDIEGAQKAGLKTFYLGDNDEINEMSDYQAESLENILELI